MRTEAPPDGALFIGALAARTGATPKAIRLYESLGLLSPVRRRGAYRVYSQRHVEQVRLVRQAQALGFKLAELKTVLQPQAGGPDWAHVAARVRDKQAAIARDIERLQALHRELDGIWSELQPCLAEQRRARAAACPLAEDDILPAIA